jgi:hypothetical protein
MDIRSISVHIRYSKPLADGSHKTVEISAKGSLAPGEDWHKAEVALYHELGETMKYIFSGNGFGKPALTGPGKPHNTPAKPVETAPSQLEPQALLPEAPDPVQEILKGRTLMVEPPTGRRLVPGSLTWQGPTVETARLSGHQWSAQLAQKGAFADDTLRLTLSLVYHGAP